MTGQRLFTVVTGAAGFLGQAVLRHLAAERIPGRVAGCVRAANGTVSWPPAVDVISVDLAHPNAVPRIRASVPADVGEQEVQVIHLAGEYLSTSPADLFDANVASTLAVLEAFGNRLGHVVYASSVAVYGSSVPGVVAPDTEYGRTKWLAESALDLFARASGIPVAVLRLGSLYGPGNTGRNAVAALTTAIVRERTFTIGPSPVRARDYLYIEDAARAVLAARGYAGTLDLGSGVTTSPYDLIDAARAAGMGFAVRDTAVGAPIVHFACDPAPARKALGLNAPVELVTGIADEVAWRLKHRGKR